MSKAFFKLQDHRRDMVGAHVRLSEVALVTDPISVHHHWVVNVHMRSGEQHTMSGDIHAIYKQRDELLYALEQDAMKSEPSAEAPERQPRNWGAALD